MLTKKRKKYRRNNPTANSKAINSEFEVIGQLLANHNLPQEIINKYWDAVNDTESHIEDLLLEVDNLKDDLKYTEEKESELISRLGDLEEFNATPQSVIINGLGIVQKQKLEEFIRAEIYPLYADESQYKIPF